MSLDELHDLDTDDITEMLGVTISPMRVKCAVLARQVAQDGAKLYHGDVEDLDITKTED